MKAIKLKELPVEVTIPYTTYQHIDKKLRYKIFNNQVVLDLKDVIDTVMADAGITGFDTEQCELTIPYNIDEAASGDTVTLLIDKRRFHIRIPEMEVVSNKQQKIDWDNTHSHRWSIAQWGKYIESRFWNYYGFQSLELDLRGKQGAIRRGKVFGNIKSMIDKILGLGCSHDDIVEYINWVFSVKSAKVAISIGFLVSDGVIQDWLIWKRKHTAGSANTSDKWR